MTSLTQYPGGKNGAGVYQRLISMMPPHTVYIEPFLGSAAVMKRKRPAALNIGIDLDAGVIASAEFIRDESTGRRFGDDPRFRFIKGDALAYLNAWDFEGDELVYCDPPYVHATRTRTDLYRFEMTDEQHRELLAVLMRIPARVILSGYWTELYAGALATWNHATFEAMTRQGKRTEHLWFNFPEPAALHDYSYYGDDFRARERLKRKRTRWVNRLRGMPLIERRALLSAITEAWPDEQDAGKNLELPSPAMAMPAESAAASLEMALSDPNGAHARGALRLPRLPRLPLG